MFIFCFRSRSVSILPFFLSDGPLFYVLNFLAFCLFQLFGFLVVFCPLNLLSWFWSFFCCAPVSGLFTVACLLHGKLLEGIFSISYFLLGLPFLPPLVLHFTEFSSFFTTWSAFLLELCSFEFCLLFSFSFFLLVHLDFWFLWVSDPFDCRFIAFVASSGPVAFVLLEMPLRLLSLFLLTSSNSVLLTVGRNTFFLLVQFLVFYFELYSVFFISCYYSWFFWLCFFWGFLLWGGISIFTYLSVLRLSYVFHKSFV